MGTIFFRFYWSFSIRRGQKHLNTWMFCCRLPGLEVGIPVQFKRYWLRTGICSGFPHRIRSNVDKMYKCVHASPNRFLLFFQSSVTLPSTTSVTPQCPSATRPSHSAILQSRLRPTTPRSSRDVPRFYSASPLTCTAARPCWTSTTARLPTPAGPPANT